MEKRRGGRVSWTAADGNGTRRWQGGDGKIKRGKRRGVWEERGVIVSSGDALKETGRERKEDGKGARGKENLNVAV